MPDIRNSQGIEEKGFSQFIPYSGVILIVGLFL